VGLIAREIESQGIPTLSLTSALSITQSVNPPRAVFLDFPLGHTAGRPHDEKIQDAIIEAALTAFETTRTAKGDEEKVRDDRTERSGEPQYQLESDRIAAE